MIESQSCEEMGASGEFHCSNVRVTGSSLGSATRLLGDL